MAYGIKDAQQFLGLLAPFARALDFQILSVAPGLVKARMPENPQLARDIGILCGQSILTAADSLGPICVASARGAYTDMTTADLNCHFLRALPVADTAIDLRLLKDGRRLSVVQAEFRSVDSDKLAATATVAYAHLSTQPGG